MSRHYETEYPPGLGRPRSDSQERNQPGSYGSYRGLVYGAMGAGSMARSLGMQEGHARDSTTYSAPLPEFAGPNRHNLTGGLAQLSSSSPFLPYNHHNPRLSPPPPPPAVSHIAHYPSSTSPSERDSIFLRHSQIVSQPQSTTSPQSIAARSTLWWGELEPWMDEEYAKQVCGLMKWDPVSIKVPHPPPDAATGQQANNPGFCFITFPSPSHAVSVLAQVANGANGGPLPMPNSTKPFIMNWASSVNASSPMSTAFPAASGPQPPAVQQYPKEYSIFVGDLAPETSNSDLVAVFRNPVLGLRNDREPKFIRPFLSCKSAKIMLDPVTGVSRGYGFVRFTDEADQQRALIEMHGLYCLSRPMRISPATAKYKAAANAGSAFDIPQVAFTPSGHTGGTDAPNPAATVALPLPSSAQPKSVSAPIAATGPNASLNSNAAPLSAPGLTMGGSQSSNSLSSGTGSSTSISTSAFGSSTSDDMMQNEALARLSQQYSALDANAFKAATNGASSYLNEQQVRQILQQQADDPSSRYGISEESWKHHAQARAILGNLIGPNGEQLTSTDPYNTTVFVGGLSPLISEDTLRTFFAPFGDIHYVKVPVGKHCGFVQFVRKADAEKAIDKMQGFPIGGSRIRLSWGRSQYKAAQAAAQAAQSAAIQTQYTPQPIVPLPSGAPTLTQDQALAILQKFTDSGYFLGGGASASYETSEIENALLSATYGPVMTSTEQIQQKLGAQLLEDGNTAFNPRPEMHRSQSNFSPFSPEPNNIYTSSESARRDSYSRAENLPHPSKAYAPGFFPVQQQQGQELKVNTSIGNSATVKVSPTGQRSSSAGLYGFMESSDPPAVLNRAPGRSEAPISRPSSGHKLGHPSSRSVDQQEELIQDLNGTLASLELDRPWKSPA